MFAVHQAVSSRTSSQQQGRPDGQMYCSDITEPVKDDVGWQIANAVDWQLWRLVCSNRYCGTLWWRHRWTVRVSLYKTRSETSNQCKSTCSSWESPQSNFLVPVTIHAAAFRTRCSLSDTLRCSNKDCAAHCVFLCCRPCLRTKGSGAPVPLPPPKIGASYSNQILHGDYTRCEAIFLHGWQQVLRCEQFAVAIVLVAVVC